MRPLLLNVDGIEINVKFIKDDASQFWHTALINGESVQYHFTKGHLLLKDSSHRIIYNTTLSGFLQTVQVDGHSVVIEFENSPGARRSANTKSSSGKQRDRMVVAPLNGQVIRILKKKGEQVEMGEKVLVLESMKMENELTAPVSGVIHRIETKEGAVVASGQLLFVIE